MRSLLTKALARISRSLPHFRGKQRTFGWLARRLLGARPFVARVAGVRFACDPAELIDFNLAFIGGHDSHVVDSMAADLATRPKAHVWDIGVNVGSVSLVLAARFPQATFACFDAAPPVMARFIANLRLNSELASRCVPHAFALADSGAMRTFHLAWQQANQGTGSLVANDSSVKVQVLSIAGDELIASGAVPRPDLIKMDVEGYEFEVLKGLEKTLTNGPSVTIVFEHCSWRLRSRAAPTDQVTSYLRSLGYQLRVTGANGDTFEVDSAALETGDLDIVASKAA